MFGWGDVLCTPIFQLSFLQHVHELDADEPGLRGVKRFEAQYWPRHLFHRTMILFHHIFQLFHRAHGDRGPVLLVVGPDGRGMGLAPVDGDVFGDAVPADRLGQETRGRLLVALLRQQKINGLTVFITAR